MEKRSLSATIRTEKGKMSAKKMRRTGVIPGVIYGQHKEPIMIEVSAHDLGVIMNNPMGKNVFIDMEVVHNSKKAKELVMVKELQRDPVSHKLIHADFYRIDMKKKVVCEIPVKEEGLSVGVHAGGRLDHLRKSVVVKCLPDQIPGVICFDVTNLNINDVFYVKDLKLPEGIEPVTHLDVAILRISAPRVEVEAEEEAAAEGEEKKEGEEETKEGEKAEDKKDETKPAKEESKGKKS